MFANPCTPGSCNPAHHLSFHKSWKSVLPQLSIAVMIAILSVYLAIDYPWSVYTAQLEVIGYNFVIPLPLGILISAVIAARPIMSVYDHRYVLACHHLDVTSGLMSVRRKHSRYSYEELLGVEVDQGIRDRLLGVGDILVGTAAHNNTRITLEGISHPGKRAKEISQRIDDARMQLGRAQPQLIRS